MNARTLLLGFDAKLDAVWEMCAKHNKPVVIHVADPAAFWTPLDKYNERWHELNQHPDWLFADGKRFPLRQEILDQLHRVIARHSKSKSKSSGGATGTAHTTGIASGGSGGSWEYEGYNMVVRRRGDDWSRGLLPALSSGKVQHGGAASG